MEFRIAVTFTDSLAKLTAEEQKAAKTTVFDLQVDPAHPGIQFHRIDKSKDKNFWSARVNRDLRLIIHRTASSLLLCYADHHDDAYRWAERRVIERHPRTGAAQLVEVRETVREIEIPQYVAAEAPVPVPKPALLAHLSAESLLAYGVPTQWLGDVRAATEDTLFALVDHLPAEAMEALLALATGDVPQLPLQTPEGTDPFAHPDAQRRFRVMANAEELERALDYPWEKWTVFLHPTQRTIVERRYNGPARVAGSAGTGKTVVALHRAVHLARTHPDARVLLTTFSDTLANALRVKLGRLAGGEPRGPQPGRHQGHRSRRAGSVRGELWSGAARRSRGPTNPPEGVLGTGADAPVQRPLPRDGVAGRRRRLAALDVGRLPGRGPSRSQDPSRGEPASPALVDLRPRPVWARRAGTGHASGRLRAGD